MYNGEEDADEQFQHISDHLPAITKVLSNLKNEIQTVTSEYWIEFLSSMYFDDEQKMCDELASWKSTLVDDQKTTVAPFTVWAETLCEEDDI
jgi:flavorubredoxin